MKKTRQTFSAKQDMIQHCASGRTMVCLNEEELTVTADAAPWNGSEARDPGTVTMYAYDVYWLERKAGGAAISTAADVLEAFKEAKVQELEAFDGSPQVNSFKFGGKRMWLDKATRVGLMNSVTIEKTSGKADTTLWFGGEPYIIDIDKAIAMLSALEIYALACYNVTEQHKARMSELTDIEAVLAYDYTTGYPQKLVF